MFSGSSATLTILNCLAVVAAVTAVVSALKYLYDERDNIAQGLRVAFGMEEGVAMDASEMGGNRRRRQRSGLERIETSRNDTLSVNVSASPGSQVESVAADSSDSGLNIGINNRQRRRR